MQKSPIVLDKLTKMNAYIQYKYKYTDADTIPNKKNTMFILDWDDTLFPTSWASKNKLDLLNPYIRDRYVVHFQELDRTLSAFLTNLSKYGKIIIVTNAVKEWVNQSSIVIPQTYNILKKIDIVSARTLFYLHSNSIMDWKKLTFKNIVEKEYRKKKVMNIISIGDAEYEHQALVGLTTTNMDKIKYLKSFRLLRDPDHDNIIDQLKVLNMYIPHLCYKRKQICKTFKKSPCVKCETTSNT